MRNILSRFRRPYIAGMAEQLMLLNSTGDGSTLSLDFTTMSSLDSRFTFSRASTTGSGSTTYINSSGLVTTATTNEPRFDYDPTTLTPRGLLIEGSATNVLQYANAFATSPWYTTNFNTPTQVTVSGVTDPAGSSSIWKCVPSGTGIHGFRQNFTFTAVAYTFSIWARSAEHNEFVISDASSGQGACRFNLTAQTATVIAGVVTPTNPTITPFPGGWFRCSFTMVMAAATRGIAYSSFPTGTTPGAFGASFTANGTDGMYFYGAQIELGSGASSYIATGASTATRAYDLAYMAGSNFTSWFSTGAGTMLFYCDNCKTNTQNLNANISDSTSNNYIRMGDNVGGGSNELVLTFVGGSTQGVADTSYNPPLNTPYKVCYAWDTNNFAACANGGTVGTDTTGSLAGAGVLTSMTLGLDFYQTSGPNDVFAKNGRIALLKYWPTRLPNATLQSLTA